MKEIDHILGLDVDREWIRIKDDDEIPCPKCGRSITFIKQNIPQEILKKYDNVDFNLYFEHFLDPGTEIEFYSNHNCKNIL